MNKLVTVLGVAAVATLAGCKDPNYQRADGSSQNEVKDASPVVADATPAAKPSCKCAPGTKHTTPCACGANDCLCVVETPAPAPQPIAKPLPPPPPPEPVYTTYIVQNGDYLAKISKKFNVTIGSIKRINGLKSDVVRVGQKLKLPGKIDVGEQRAPMTVSVSVKAPKKSASAYTGATVEYVVKNGDTLGAIAYGHGCNIRQLKALNGLTKDSLRIGQKLKVPATKAEKKSAKKSAAPAAKVPEKVASPAETPAPAADAAPAEGTTASTVAPAEAAPAADAAPAAAPAETAPATAPATEAAPAAEAAPEVKTYVVPEGEDITAVAIRWGVSAAQIRELNNLSDDANLTAGQVIKLPAEAQQ